MPPTSECPLLPSAHDISECRELPGRTNVADDAILIADLNVAAEGSVLVPREYHERFCQNCLHAKHCSGCARH